METAAPLRSLRVKLTLWFALAFVGLQVLLAVSLVAYRRDAIRRANADAVERFAGRMADSVVTLEGNWSAEALGAVVPDGSRFAQGAVRSSDGSVLASWNARDADALPFTPWETVPAGPLGPVITRLERDATLAVVTQPFRHEERMLYLQAAFPAELLEAELGNLRDLLWIGVPLGLGVALLIAWNLSFRAVRPLARLREAARGVSPASLDRRIRVDSGDAEVAALEGELNRALERLADGYRAQEEFLANVTHELKSPLAVLRAEAQLVHRDGAREEALRAFARSADEELRRLDGLVESLLTLTRTELAWERLHRERLDVADLVLDSIRNCAALAEARDVRLVPRLAEAEGGAAVVGDRILLGTVLDNLVRNAVRHTPHGGRVDLGARRDGGRVRIEVRDQGPGIAPADRARVFARGERGLSADGKRGMGLGLAIASSVSELHGGTIGFGADDGTGCTFVLDLPALQEG